MINNKKVIFRVPADAVELAKEVIPGAKYETVRPEDGDECVSAEDAVVICGPWPMPLAPTAVLRLCSTCGAEIGVSPPSANARQFLCMKCGREIIEAQNGL